MIPHGYVTASDKTREPGREADQLGSWVQQVPSGDWTSRPDESDYIWVCLICLKAYSLYIIIILTFARLRGKLLNFKAWYAYMCEL